jgi:hypothetical protein
MFLAVLAVLAHLASFSFRFFIVFSFYFGFRFGALEALGVLHHRRGAWSYITPPG